MNINELLEQQKVEALLKNGSGWIVAAEEILRQVAEIREHQKVLEERMAMYDQPVVEEALAVEVAEPVEATKEVAEPSWGSHDEARQRVNALIDSGAAERIRKKAGLSAGDVARALGVTSGGVRGWETGKWHPSNSKVEAYLSFLLGLEQGERPEPPAKGEAKPNGLKCLFCGRDLYGKQKKFDTKECAQSYAYIKKQNPEATNSEIKTLIAGVGWQDAGKQRRKYKKLDQVRAEQNIQRAREAQVPALT